MFSPFAMNKHWENRIHAPQLWPLRYNLRTFCGQSHALTWTLSATNLINWNKISFFPFSGNRFRSWRTNLKLNKAWNRSQWVEIFHGLSHADWGQGRDGGQSHQGRRKMGAFFKHLFRSTGRILKEKRQIGFPTTALHDWLKRCLVTHQTLPNLGKRSIKIDFFFSLERCCGRTKRSDANKEGLNGNQVGASLSPKCCNMFV